MAPRIIKLMGDSGESSFAPGTLDFNPKWVGVPGTLSVQQGQSIPTAQYIVDGAPPFAFELDPSSTVLTGTNVDYIADGQFVAAANAVLGTLTGLVLRVIDVNLLYGVSHALSLTITPSPPVWTGPPSPQQIFRGQPLDISGYVSATTAIASFSISPLSTVSEATLNAGGITLNHTGGFFTAAANATLVSYPNVIVRAALAGGLLTDSFAFSLNVLSQNGIVGTWFEDQSLTVPKGGTFDFTTWNIGEVPGPNLTYSLLAATLDCKTHAISAYSAALVPSYLTLNPATGVMTVSGSAPASQNPYLLLKVQQSDGITSRTTTSPISLCITEAAPVTFQAWTGDKDAGGTRVNLTDYSDPNQAFAAAPLNGGYVYATSGSYFGATIIPRANSTQYLRCLTGPTGGRIVMDGGGAAVSPNGRALIHNGQGANAPVNYTLDVRHIWARRTKGTDANYVNASPNNTRAVCDMVQTTDRTQNLTLEDCIFEDVGMAMQSSRNYGNFICHNNLFLNVGATSNGSADLHTMYPHGVFIDYRGNNNFWTYSYSDLPFTGDTGDKSLSQRCRACVGHMLKTRMEVSYICGNYFDNQRGSHSELVDFSQNGINYEDGNDINEGPFSANIGAYGIVGPDNKITGFGTSDAGQTFETGNELHSRLNTIRNSGLNGEWFYRMVVRLVMSSTSPGDAFSSTTGADPSTVADGQIVVNTTTNNFTMLNASAPAPTSVLQNGIGMQPGTSIRFRFTSGSIAGVVNGRPYYCIPIADGTNNHFAIADTKALAIAGTKKDLTAATAGNVIIESVPDVMDIQDNVLVGTTQDSNGALLGYDGAGLEYALNTRNSYVPVSALQDQDIYNGNYALTTPVPAAQLYADPTGATDYYSPT